MAMVMVLFRFTDGDYTSMSDFADSVLELDGGVVDPKVVMEAVFHVAQDSLTH